MLYTLNFHFKTAVDFNLLDDVLYAYELDGHRDQFKPILDVNNVNDDIIPLLLKDLLKMDDTMRFRLVCSTDKYENYKFINYTDGVLVEYKLDQVITKFLLEWK